MTEISLVAISRAINVSIIIIYDDEKTPKIYRRRNEEGECLKCYIGNEDSWHFVSLKELKKSNILEELYQNTETMTD